MAERLNLLLFAASPLGLRFATASISNVLAEVSVGLSCVVVSLAVSAETFSVLV